jgi:hypothetical protein
MVDGGDDIETNNVDSDCECSRNMEIWVDEHSMIVLNGKQLTNECNEKEQSKVNRCILHYYQNNDSHMFKGLVPRLEDW